MNNPDNLHHLKLFMAAAEQEIEQIGLVKRIEDRYPFDSLADEIFSKAFALARSVIILIEQDQPEEALGLARSIVECALNLRWITAVPGEIQKRSFTFVRFGMAMKNFWYWWVKKRYPAGEKAEDADRYAAEWDLAADATGAFKHWSGERQFARTASELEHPLGSDKMSVEDRAARRAHDYIHPSCFVHCSQPGVDSYFSEQRAFAIHRHKFDERDFGREAILICNSYLHDLIVYGFYGMNVYLLAPLDCLRKHEFDTDIEEYRFLP